MFERVYGGSHPSLAAAYAVHFDLDDGARPDRIVSGLAGFKTVTRRLLRSVRVTFQGEAPEPAVLRTSADRACDQGGAPLLDESLLVGGDGGLQNAFVYVKDGLGDYIFDVPTEPVVLDQKGCKYEPHVFGVRVGQRIEILNSDPTLHNVHAIPKNNDEFNFGQQPSTPPVTRRFDEPEIGASFRCDVHGWMRAYAGVVEHPFYAVSGPNGEFSFEGLPPGTYTIEAWHERLGTQTQTVTITEGAPAATAEFTFQPE